MESSVNALDLTRDHPRSPRETLDSLWFDVYDLEEGRI